MEDTGESQESTEEAPAAEGGEEGSQAAASAEGAEPGERRPRKQKREDFVGEARREATEARRIVQEEREARIRLEAQIGELRQHITPRKHEAGAEDYQKRLGEARQKYEMAAALSAGAKTQAEARMHLDAAWKAQDDMNDIQAERREAALMERFQSMVPNQAAQEEKQVIAAEFPWVRTDEEGRALADAKFNRLVASGRPPNRETMREALAQTARQLGLGGQSPPSQQSRRAYEGTETRDGGGGGGGNGRGVTEAMVKNHDGYRKLATGRYPELEPDAAIKKWVERVGSKLGQA